MRTIRIAHNWGARNSGFYCIQNVTTITSDERIKIIEIFTISQSILVTQQKFKTFYGTKDAPVSKSIGHIVAKLKINGSVSDKQHGCVRAELGTLRR